MIPTIFVCVNHEIDGKTLRSHAHSGGKQGNWLIPWMQSRKFNVEILLHPQHFAYLFGFMNSNIYKLKNTWFFAKNIWEKAAFLSKTTIKDVCKSQNISSFCLRCKLVVNYFSTAWISSILEPPDPQETTCLNSFPINHIVHVNKGCNFV